MSEQPSKPSRKTIKGHEQKKPQSSPKENHSKKQQRKGENPVRIPLRTDPSSTSWICKNSACRATIPMDDSFCKRCSCCICHLFDDNKDPSLWLECGSEAPHGESCGLTCHVECAIQQGKVGVVNLGQLMQLDGSHCCASCGKVSGILRFWKKQLGIAKDARRVDILCYRIHLCFRLFDGTCRFGELHEIVKDAKAKLETEVGPLDGGSASMARGIVSRLSVAGDVQLLCSLAMEKADEYLDAKSSSSLNLGECSLPAACKFLFEEVTSSSIVIVLIELSVEDVKGYKLWYRRNREDAYTDEPVCVFPRTQRRILVSNLLPCSEYSFRIVSYTESGDLGHSEAKCFTKSVEIFSRASTAAGTESPATVVEPDSGFKVRDLGRILRLAWARGAQDDRKTCPLPDLNEELTPPVDSSCDEVEEGSWNKKRKRSLHDDSDSTLVSGGSHNELFENFEYCVKIIRWLECEGYLEKDFRLKLLTWFSLRSTEQEQRVVHTFIQTLADDPISLAGQLVDSFSDVVANKRSRNSFCSRLWH